MAINTVVAHDNVAANRGRVALERGPIVYCFEAVDNSGTVSDIVLPAEAELQVEHRPELLGGVNVITGQALRAARTTGRFDLAQPHDRHRDSLLRMGAPADR